MESSRVGLGPPHGLSTSETLRRGPSENREHSSKQGTRWWAEAHPTALAHRRCSLADSMPATWRGTETHQILTQSCDFVGALCGAVANV